MKKLLVLGLVLWALAFAGLASAAIGGDGGGAPQCNYYRLGWKFSNGNATYTCVTENIGASNCYKWWNPYYGAFGQWCQFCLYDARGCSR